MTPKERADKLLYERYITPIQLDDIIAAIRDARNEALERAALEAEAYGLGSAKNVAPYIRALKHAEPGS